MDGTDSSATSMHQHLDRPPQLSNLDFSPGFGPDLDISTLNHSELQFVQKHVHVVVGASGKTKKFVLTCEPEEGELNNSEVEKPVAFADRLTSQGGYSPVSREGGFPRTRGTFHEGLLGRNDFGNRGRGGSYPYRGAGGGARMDRSMSVPATAGFGVRGTTDTTGYTSIAHLETSSSRSVEIHPDSTFEVWHELDGRPSNENCLHTNHYTVGTRGPTSVSSSAEDLIYDKADNAWAAGGQPRIIRSFTTPVTISSASTNPDGSPFDYETYATHGRQRTIATTPMVNSDFVANGYPTDWPVFVSMSVPGSGLKSPGTPDASSIRTSSSFNSRRGTVLSIGSSFQRTELPGEKLIFTCDKLFAAENPAAMNLEAMEAKPIATLRIFKSDDGRWLRFLTIFEKNEFEEGGQKEVKFKLEEAEYVPAYTNSSATGPLAYPVYIQSANTQPQALTPVYEFGQWKDLRSFQCAMLSEDLNFDIDRVASVTFQEEGTNVVQNYASGCRVQLWHERLAKLTLPDDNQSIMTNNTACSGPLPENVRIANSRLVVFFGHKMEFLTLLLTGKIHADWSKDGLTVEIRSSESSGSPFSLIISKRPPFRCKHVKVPNGQRTIGIPLTKKGLAAQDSDSWQKFRFLQLTFETKANREQFKERWCEMMAKRKKEWKRIGGIKEAMAKHGFTGQEALKIF